MKIIILNGSPHPNGNTANLIDAFVQGTEQGEHEVTVMSICSMNIAGCKGCEYCHKIKKGECIQKDDMEGIYQALETAEMLVLASPVYYFGFSGQLQCALHRTYAVGIPKKLKKSMLILSSGSEDVYEGAVYEYKKTCIEYMQLENMGIFLHAEKKENLSEVQNALRVCGENLNTYNSDFD